MKHLMITHSVSSTIVLLNPLRSLDLKTEGRLIHCKRWVLCCAPPAPKSAARVSAPGVSGRWVGWHWQGSRVPPALPWEALLQGLKNDFCPSNSACSAALPCQESAASAEPKAARPENDRKHLVSISFCFLLILFFPCTCYSGSQVLARTQRCSPQPQHIHQCEDYSVCQHFLHNTWEHSETSTSCLSQIPVKHGFNSTLCLRLVYPQACSSSQLCLWSQSRNTLSADNLI